MSAWCRKEGAIDGGAGNASSRWRGARAVARRRGPTLWSLTSTCSPPQWILGIALMDVICRSLMRPADTAMPARDRERTAARKRDES